MLQAPGNIPTTLTSTTVNNKSAKPEQQGPLTFSATNSRDMEALQTLLKPYPWQKEQNFAANIFAAIQAGHFPTNRDITLVGFTFYLPGKTIKLPPHVELQNCLVGANTTLRFHKGNATAISRGAVVVAMGITALAIATAAESSAYGVAAGSHIEGRHKDAILIKFNRLVTSTTINGCPSATECYSAKALERILGKKFNDDLNFRISYGFKHSHSILVPLPQTKYHWTDSAQSITVKVPRQTASLQDSKNLPPINPSVSTPNLPSVSPGQRKATTPVANNQLSGDQSTNAASFTSASDDMETKLDALLQTLENQANENALDELDTLLQPDNNSTAQTKIEITEAEIKTSGNSSRFSDGPVVNPTSNETFFTDDVLDEILDLLTSNDNAPINAANNAADHLDDPVEEASQTITNTTTLTSFTTTTNTTTTSVLTTTTPVNQKRGRRDIRLNRDNTQGATEGIRKQRFVELVNKAPGELNKDDRDFLFKQISQNKDSYTKEQINAARKLVKEFDFLNLTPRKGIGYFDKPQLASILEDTKAKLGNALSEEMEKEKKESAKQNGGNILSKMFSSNATEKDHSTKKSDQIKPQLTRMMVFKHTVDTISDPKKFDNIYKNAANNHKKWSEQIAPKNDVVKQPSSCVVEVIAGDWGCVTRDMSMKHGGQIYVVLNMANELDPGGGTALGAAAQEENMFRRTDCSQTGKPEEMAKNTDESFVISSHHASIKYNKETTDLIGSEQGKVYLDIEHPRVCFKASEADNYKELDPGQCFLFYEMRSAALDLRQQKNRTLAPQLREESTRKRIGAQLNTAIEAGQRHLVLSAFGCGAFEHDANDVSRLFKEEIAKRQDKFDHIVFAIFTGTSSSASSASDQAYNSRSARNLAVFQKTFSMGS